jgi:HEAT repeat protein
VKLLTSRAITAFVSPAHDDLAQSPDPNLRLLDSAFPFEVKRAQDALVARGIEAVAPLCGRLLDPKGRPRPHVLLTLMRLGVGPILTVLPELSVREKLAALRVLGVLGRQWATLPVIEELASEDSAVRSAAAAALGKMHDARAVAPLEGCVGDPEAEVRARAVEALGNLRAPGSTAVLVAAMEDRSVEVRRAAATAIGRFDDPCVGDALCAALFDEDRFVRAEAAGAVGRMAREDAGPRLLALFLHDRSPVREAAALALGRCGDESAIGPLCALLPKTGPDTQLAICKALTALAPRYPHPQLQTALPELHRLSLLWTDAPSRVRSAAATAHAAIVQATAAVRDLPTPAAKGDPSADALPIPGEAPTPAEAR